MPHSFAIEQRLPRRLLAAFHELILDRAVTIDAARIWLEGQGFGVSRSAVGRYIRYAHSSGLFPLRRIAGLSDDRATRRQIAVWTRRLSGDDLSHLALIAVYLLNIQAARRAEKLTKIPGCISMNLKGNRTPK